MKKEMLRIIVSFALFLLLVGKVLLSFAQIPQSFAEISGYTGLFAAAAHGDEGMVQILERDGPIGGTQPRIEPLRASPPRYNYLGFDVSYESELFPSLDGILKQCREERMTPADCKTRLVCTIDGYEFISLVASWTEDGRTMMSSELLSRKTANGQVWNLFWVAIDLGFGSTGNIEYFESPAGPLLRLPVSIAGTGSFNRHFHFIWQNGAWWEIEAQEWLKELKLPPGHGVWKGAAVDPASFTARSQVWREKDGNCCPSGGEVEVKLDLEGRTLKIKSQTYRPKRSE
jgi:hypothetical protein